MARVSPNDLKDIKEQMFREFHHVHVILEEIHDTIRNLPLLKNQNSEIPIELENTGAISPAALSNTPIPVSIETPWVTPKRCTVPVNVALSQC